MSRRWMTRQQFAQVRHFIGELLRQWQFQPLTGTAAARVVKCAMHKKTFKKTGAGIVSPLLQAEKPSARRRDKQ